MSTRTLRLAAWAGVAGPVLFALSFLAQQAWYGEDFDRWRLPVSALEGMSHGWIMQATFVVFGLLTMVHAVGIHRAIAPARPGITGPTVLFVSGVASLLAAAFPLEIDAAGEAYDPGGHAIAGTVFFFANPVALILLSRRMRRDAAWAGLAAYTLAAGIALVASAVFMGVAVIPDGAPLHEYAGLGQQLLVLLLLFPCRIALALRMTRVVAEGPARGQVGNSVRSSRNA